MARLGVFVVLFFWSLKRGAGKKKEGMGQEGGAGKWPSVTVKLSENVSWRSEKVGK